MICSCFETASTIDFIVGDWSEFDPFGEVETGFVVVAKCCGGGAAAICCALAAVARASINIDCSLMLDCWPPFAIAGLAVTAAAAAVKAGDNLTCAGNAWATDFVGSVRGEEEVALPADFGRVAASGAGAIVAGVTGIIIPFGPIAYPNLVKSVGPSFSSAWFFLLYDFRLFLMKPTKSGLPFRNN